MTRHRRHLQPTSQEVTVTAASGDCDVVAADIVTHVRGLITASTEGSLVTDEVVSNANLSLLIEDPATSYGLTCGDTPGHTVTLLLSDGCDLSDDVMTTVTVEVRENDAPTAVNDPTAVVMIALSEDACDIAEADLLDSILAITDLGFMDVCTDDTDIVTVSYTHLTLPTNREV